MILAFTDLSSAELINTDLRGTNLQGANLSGTQLDAIVDEQTRLPRGYQARLQPEHGPETLDSSAYKKQIEQLTLENAGLQEKLKNERQQAEGFITQLQQNINNLKNSLKSLEEQNKQERQSIKALITERDHLKKLLQTALEKEKQLSSALQTTEANTKLQQQPPIPDKRHKYSHRSQQKQEILEKAREWPKLIRLIELLAAQKWKKADEETHCVILEISGLSRKNKSGLEKDYIYRFPITALQAIDQLWLNYSSGHFGFSVQSSIWQSAGGNDTEQVLQAVGDCLGWYKDSNWCWYDNLQFSLDAPRGHLPARVYDRWQGRGVVFQPSWATLLLIQELR